MLLIRKEGHGQEQWMLSATAGTLYIKSHPCLWLLCFGLLWIAPWDLSVHKKAGKIQWSSMVQLSSYFGLVHSTNWTDGCAALCKYSLIYVSYLGPDKHGVSAWQAPLPTFFQGTSTRCTQTHICTNADQSSELIFEGQLKLGRVPRQWYVRSLTKVPVRVGVVTHYISISRCISLSFIFLFMSMCLTMGQAPSISVPVSVFMSGSTSVSVSQSVLPCACAYVFVSDFDSISVHFFELDLSVSGALTVPCVCTPRRPGRLRAHGHGHVHLVYWPPFTYMNPCTIRSLI